MMSGERMTAAVVTISDSTFAESRIDTSGPAIQARLEADGFSVAFTKIVPDEAPQIAQALIELADKVRVIVTTGGTGVTERDVTPEAVRMVIEKEMPGLGELMRAEGLKKTRMAALSRSMAGTRGRVFIAAVPGSPKGAVESLDAILNLVPHILDLIDGNTAHSQETEGRGNTSN